MHFNLKQHGFSLFEILIAIAILSFMMLGVIQFTQTTFDTSERVIREDGEALQIETALSRLEWDFSQIYSPLYYDHLMKREEMSEQELEVYTQMIASYRSNNRFKKPSYNSYPIPEFQFEDKTTLTFFTTSNRRKFVDSKQSNFAWVRYSLVPNEEKDDTDLVQVTTKEKQSTLVLARQVVNQNIYDPAEIDWDNIKVQPLHRKIKKIIYEFWNPKKFKWTDNLSTIENGKSIIYALRVTVEYLNADNLEQTTVRIFRPLFPEFTPEDMYKFLNKTINTNNNNGTNNGQAGGNLP